MPLHDIVLVRWWQRHGELVICKWEFWRCLLWRVWGLTIDMWVLLWSRQWPRGNWRHGLQRVWWQWRFEVCLGGGDWDSWFCLDNLVLVESKTQLGEPNWVQSGVSFVWVMILFVSNWGSVVQLGSTTVFFFFFWLDMSGAFVDWLRFGCEIWWWFLGCWFWFWIVTEIEVCSYTNLMYHEGCKSKKQRKNKTTLGFTT
jgi:hypothetical protein